MTDCASQRRPLDILWRGPLDSCNYACAYCPFAKRAPSSATLDRDRQALLRFVEWVLADHGFSLRILFTPYGEALIWPWYREALVRLSSAPQVRQVSIQTNGSGPMSFLNEATRTKVSLWISWHPTEISLIPFAQKIERLHSQGTRLSVGAVAVPDHLEQVEALRRALPDSVPMWLNAQKPGVRYRDGELSRWRSIDPEFDLDRRRHRSVGRACMTGEESISIDGDGAISRCHFVGEVLGNLYTDDLETLLTPRPCPQQTCGCWIGYSTLAELNLRSRYCSDGFLARIRTLPQPMPMEGGNSD